MGTNAPNFELAVRNLDRSLAIDCTAPTLLDIMHISQKVSGTASGLADHDYPILTNIPLVQQALNQAKVSRRIPLPREVLGHVNKVQTNSLMGLFPEIGRAWLTTDSDLYLWRYEENIDLAYYDGISETILNVSLVYPRVGVFHDYIKHLLVLVTAIDIVVLAVTFTESPSTHMEEIQLIPEPVFRLPTDGVVFTVIKGTQDGRIFMGTKDGNLYEIVYRPQGRWFSNRCKLVNLSTSTLSFLVPKFINSVLADNEAIIDVVVDDSRHILYALGDKGSIEVCDLGVKGDSFNKVIKVAQSTIVNHAMNIVRTLDGQTFRPIVSISALESWESGHLNLVAITQTGVRFYFSTHNVLNCPPNQRPYTLNLIHVRMSPGFSANATTRPRAVHLANYTDRNMLLLSRLNDRDALWYISSDLFPFSRDFMEAYSTFTIDGVALALAHVPVTARPHRDPLDYCPLVVRQHVEAPKKYIVMTSDSVYIILQQRPIDVFRQLLTQWRGKDNDIIKTFFAIQREDQACATSLILSSLELDNDTDIADLSSQVLTIFGSDVSTISPQQQPQHQTHGIATSTMFSPNVVSTPGPHMQHSQLESPLNTLSQLPDLSMNQSQRFDSAVASITYSARHNGFYLYLGRILRPIWNRKCIQRVAIDDKMYSTVSAISSECCSLLLTYLNALRKYVEFNSYLICEKANTYELSTANDTTGVHFRTQTTQTRSSGADMSPDEAASMRAFKSFLERCCETIGLWKILCDHQFPVLLAQLHESQLQILENITFKELLLYGEENCSGLITLLINSYLGDNASIDSISTTLRNACPHLFKLEDAAFSKANEMLRSSMQIQNIDEQNELVSNALQLCKSIAPNLDLSSICKQFVSLKAYDAVLDLCITCAKKVDPKDVALGFYKNSSTVPEQEGRNMYKKRMAIYKEIFNMLDTLYNKSLPLNVTTSAADQSTKQECSSNANIAHAEPINRQSYIFKLIESIPNMPDELLHVALYDWMLSVQLTSDLIKLNSATLETYLIRCSSNAQQAQDASGEQATIRMLDLLWKHYENNQNHGAAARILDNLAQRPSAHINMQQRIEYLTRAILCMRSDKIGYAPYLGVYLRDLEDKLEVARVQEQIYTEIEKRQRQLQSHHPGLSEALKALNENLYNISQLYEKFAEPFELWECQLAIVDTAGHTDREFVEVIWRKILKETIRDTNRAPDLHSSAKLAHILCRVKEIVSHLNTNRHCFPIEMLLSDLEQLSTHLRADERLVPEAFIAMGASVSELLEIYNRLISRISEFSVWQREDAGFHLFMSVKHVLTTFMRDCNQLGSEQKKKVITHCQDTVASILSALYSKPNTEALIGDYRRIQNELATL